jgi:ligand-binding sensor domain-containing protein
LSASAPEPSFADRLRERTVQKTQAQQEAEARMREQFERLARETAAREIQRRQEEEALAAEERALLEQQVQ